MPMIFPFLPGTDISIVSPYTAIALAQHKTLFGSQYQPGPDPE